jgi:ubiquinone/menaquinone biosynthesis C-methylase UbiE
MAEKAQSGRVVGIDIADEMIAIAREQSAALSNVEFRVASAEKLPFQDDEFTHSFSMESIYYYADVLVALKEIKRVLEPRGTFVTVVDLYAENEPSGQWVDQLKVPVHFLSIADYHSLFEQAGFVNVRDQRLHDQKPVREDYSGSFKTREDYVLYKQTGSLMLSGEASG